MIQGLNQSLLSSILHLQAASTWCNLMSFLEAILDNPMSFLAAASNHIITASDNHMIIPSGIPKACCLLTRATTNMIHPKFLKFRWKGTTTILTCTTHILVLRTRCKGLLATILSIPSNSMLRITIKINNTLIWIKRNNKTSLSQETLHPLVWIFLRLLTPIAAGRLSKSNLQWFLLKPYLNLNWTCRWISASHNGTENKLR